MLFPRLCRSLPVSLLPCLLLAVAILAAPWAEVSASQGGTGGGPVSGTVLVTVVEAGTDDGTGNPLPLPGAFVMIGEEDGVPFAGNVGTSDANGEIVFSDASLYGPQTVTAGADGYQFYTFADADASEIVIPLSPRTPSAATSNVTGSLSSFSGVDCDNWIQLSIVTPALSLADLVGFNIQGQLSDKVPIDIMGNTTYVPGNLVIPRQKENPYLLCALFGAIIEKPTYQLKLPTGTTQNLFSFGAQADIDALMGGQFDLSLIHPLEVGIARNVVVNGNVTANISMASALNQNLTLMTANSPAGSTVLLLSLGEINGGTGGAPGVGDIVFLDFAQVAGGAVGGATLRTTPRVAPFADIRYLSLAIASNSATLDLTGVTGQLDRGDYAPPATRWLSNFFTPVQLDPVAGNLFSFTSTWNPGVSPSPDMNLASLSMVTTVPDTRPGAEPGATMDVSDRLWTIASPGEDLAFALPALPPGAPEILADPDGTPQTDRLMWSQTVVALSLDPTFDFDSYDMASFDESFTHFTADSREFSVDSDGDDIHLFDDNCPAVYNPDQQDLDGDGRGDACDADADGDGYAAGPEDCDDMNPAVYAGAFEVCNDTFDNDCDGLADLDDTDCYSCTDNDGDHYGQEGGSCGPVDCNDANPAIHPGTPEVCDDAIDNDCDGLADASDPECIPTCTDSDGDSFYVGGSSCEPLDCNDANRFVHPGAREACDGLDNDCNPGTGDGTGESWLGIVCDGSDADLCGEGILACQAGVPTCTDQTGDTPDLCDGADNDCNPATPDGSGEPWLGSSCDGTDTDLCAEGSSVCVSGNRGCTDNTDDNRERCDGLDNDCNPATADGADEHWVGALCDGPDTDLCGEGTYQCQASSAVCTDNTGDNVELCDGLDNNCDGVYPPDEADADGDGVRICAGDCNDADRLVYPGSAELCDGKDNNCDGTVPADEADADGDHYRICADDCDDTDPAVSPGDTEVCDDGIDNDCDGEVDNCDPPPEPWGPASVTGGPTGSSSSAAANHALLLLLPLAAVAALRRSFRAG